MSASEKKLVLEPTEVLPRRLEITHDLRIVSAVVEVPGREHRAVAMGQGSLARCRLYLHPDGECSFWVGSTRFEITAGEMERIGAELGLAVEPLFESEERAS